MSIELQCLNCEGNTFSLYLLQARIIFVVFSAIQCNFSQILHGRHVECDAFVLMSLFLLVCLLFLIVNLKVLSCLPPLGSFLHNSEIL